MIQRLLVTGYKAHELGVFDRKHPGIKFIKKALEKRITSLLEEGLEWVIISGQQGVEIWAAELVLDMKMEYPDLQLAVITPFLEQEINWKEENREHYQFILDSADFVSTITKRPYEGPWQFKARNQFLLDHTDGLLIIYDEDNPGTPKFIMDEALKRVDNNGYELMTITSYDLQDVVDEEQEIDSTF